MTPRYAAGDIARDRRRPGNRSLILAVGEESYFVRSLGDLALGQPREAAWAFEGMESVTELEPRAVVGLPAAGADGAV